VIASPITIGTAGVNGKSQKVKGKGKMTSQNG